MRKSKMAGLWIRMNERGAYGGRAGLAVGRGGKANRGSLAVWARDLRFVL